VTNYNKQADRHEAAIQLPAGSLDCQHSPVTCNQTDIIISTGSRPVADSGRDFFVRKKRKKRETKTVHLRKVDKLWSRQTYVPTPYWHTVRMCLYHAIDWVIECAILAQQLLAKGCKNSTIINFYCLIQLRHSSQWTCGSHRPREGSHWDMITGLGVKGYHVLCSFSF
jgi:hypothetical protein